MRYFDKEGRLISLTKWAQLFEDAEYKRVAWDKLPDGRVVSTAWMGLDHRRFSAGAPLIFETMVLAGEEGEWGAQRRYSTLAEALAGHAELLAELTKGGSGG